MGLASKRKELKEMEIRSMREDDIEDILELHFHSMRERNCYIDTPELSEDLKEFSHFYGDSKGHFCVALSSDQIVGMGGVCSYDRVHGELRHLYVTRPFREQQVGSAIMQFLLDAAKNESYETIGAHTMEHMHPVQGLLKKYGFKAIRRYKQDGQEQVYFQK